MGAQKTKADRWRTAMMTLFTISLVALAGFIYFHDGPAGQSLELIVYPGEYPSADGKYIANVTVNSEEEVEYQVVEKQSGLQSFVGNIGKSNEPWCMSWDRSANFWVCGEGDPLVYVRVPRGDYKCYSLREKDYSKSMPAKFRKFFNGEPIE